MADWNQKKENHPEVIGLLPAGGQAARIAPLPCSKELYPVSFQKNNENGNLRPKAVCINLLEKMRLAGITKVYVILRDGKWDIPAYLGDGNMLNMDIAYLIMRLPFGAPYTLDQAYPFVQDSLVAFGFPDIIFKAEDSFVRLLERQSETNADIVLGVFPVEESQKWDMVNICDNGRIKQILKKPIKSNLHYAWIIAVWTPVFTHFMHKCLSTFQDAEIHDNTRDDISQQRELFVGDVIQDAINNDLRVEGVIFPDSSCLDIGTPEDLVKAVRSETTLKDMC